MIYLHDKTVIDGKVSLKMIRDRFRLAGKNNLIHNIWVQKGMPTNREWKISNGDLLSYLKSAQPKLSCPSIIIDFDPKGKEEISLLELREIYAYTCADNNNKEIWWTPTMLKLTQIFYSKNQEKLDPLSRKSIISCFSISECSVGIIEFLYLQGEKGHWNWGMVGRVNGALLYGKPWEYFKRNL